MNSSVGAQTSFCLMGSQYKHFGVERGEEKCFITFRYLKCTSTASAHVEYSANNMS